MIRRTVRSRRIGWRAVGLLLFLGIGTRTADAIEHVTIRSPDGERALQGRVLVEGEDGSLLFQGLDGVLWVVEREQIVGRRTDTRPFVPLTQKQMALRLLEEFPRGFQIETTKHYVICYNTSPAYAKWCGHLWERLYRGFANFWKTRGLPLRDPEFPLVAVIFDSEEAFQTYSKEELGSAVGAVIGYYNFQTNRVVTFDLTGLAGTSRLRRRRYSMAQIRQLLAQPASERNVATLIHEVTHQLAYNRGIHTRYAGNPFWVVEGLACYFETPDLQSATGWRGMGRVNRYRLVEFRRRGRRLPGWLAGIVRADDDFRDSQTANAAYADAWAVHYFLLKKRTRNYVAYLRELASLKPLDEPSPEARLEVFQKHFGDITRLERDITNTMRRLR